MRPSDNRCGSNEVELTICKNVNDILQASSSSSSLLKRAEIAVLLEILREPGTGGTAGTAPLMPRRSDILRLGQSAPRQACDHGGKSRQARGYGRAWDKLRILVLARDKHLCQPCRRAGRVTAATAVDHLIPKAKGGTDDISNLQAICGPCHRAKSIADQGGRVRLSIAEDGWPIE